MVASGMFLGVKNLTLKRMDLTLFNDALKNFRQQKAAYNGNLFILL